MFFMCFLGSLVFLIPVVAKSSTRGAVRAAGQRGSGCGATRCGRLSTGPSGGTAPRARSCCSRTPVRCGCPKLIWFTKWKNPTNIWFTNIYETELEGITTIWFTNTFQNLCQFVKIIVSKWKHPSCVFWFWKCVDKNILICFILINLSKNTRFDVS